MTWQASITVRGAAADYDRDEEFSAGGDFTPTPAVPVTTPAAGRRSVARAATDASRVTNAEVRSQVQDLLSKAAGDHTPYQRRALKVPVDDGDKPSALAGATEHADAELVSSYRMMYSPPSEASRSTLFEYGQTVARCVVVAFFFLFTYYA